MAGKKRFKRESGKLVILNEEELIRQVEMKPILYDKSLKGYRKSGLRYQFWKEVSEAVGATAEECRRRWRSLRDAFSKHYKYLNRSDEAALGKRKKWVFYDQMSFMAQYLDNSCYEIEDALLEDFADNSEDTIMMQSESGKKCCLETIDTPATLDIETNEQFDRKEDIVIDSQLLCTNDGDDVHHLIASITSDTDGLSTSVTLEPPPSEVPSKEASEHHSPRTDAPATPPTAMCLDSDEKFLMSCAPILRRLTHRKNALARLKIQQILYNIEFESEES